MRFIFVAALFALPYAFCAPTDSKLRTTNGPFVKDSYIVVLKDNASRSSHIHNIRAILTDSDAILYDSWRVLNGYAAKLVPATLARVLSDPGVAYVEANGIVTINAGIVERKASGNPGNVLTTREAAGTGEGVDIYSIDTGVYLEHSAFGGRATWGATFGGYADADGNGHGTHTMGIAAGVGFGPATSASIIAVKVLDDYGSGAWADVISGIDWVATHSQTTGRPSVINMSLGGYATDAVDSATASAIASGVHITVAAGNSNWDADNYSPARVPTAVTVGAIDYSKAKAYFSNYGADLDVWYYGVDVLSAYIGSPNATTYLSGTSMAAPGVAGILAVELGAGGDQSHTDLSDALEKNAVADVSGSPAGTTTLRAVLW